MKKLSVKTVVAIGIGAALFFVLGKISIPTPVPNTYVSFTVCDPGCICHIIRADCRASDRIYRAYAD